MNAKHLTIGSYSPFRLAIAACLGGVLARDTAGGAVAFEPVRRDAEVVVNTIELGAPFGRTVSGGLVLPRATTRELAEYARATGGAAAAQWFCRGYTNEPPARPDSGSLRRLLARIAAEGEIGVAATNALACPRIPRRARKHHTKLKDGGCIFNPFGGCDHEDRISDSFVSSDLAYQGCTATEAERQGFDGATCERILLGHSGRATALRVFSRRAARKSACLKLALHASASALDGVPFGSAVQLYVESDTCR